MAEDTATRIHELAAEAYACFETRTRDDDSRFVTLKDDAPEWVRAIVMDAHGDFLPEDWRYEAIREAFEKIEDAGEFADEAETGDEFADDVDIYTAELLKWLASNLNRPGYCDEAVAEGLAGDPGQGGSEDIGIVRRIALGQFMERREVFGYVWRGLEEHAEDIEDEE